jgi:hypothetical protein
MTWPLSRCGRLGRQRPPTARSITARVSNDEAVPRAQARSRSPTASPPGPGFDSRGGSLSRLDIPPGQAAGTRAGPDGDPGANSF